MGWEAIIPLLIQYGFPVAIKLVEKWEQGGAVTSAEVKDLMVLAEQNKVGQMTNALIRGGVDPTSEKGKALLALVK